MNDIARRLESLSPEQRRLLELRLRKQGIDPSRLCRIPRRKEPEAAPLSFAQQRLWFLAQLDPGSSSYNLPGAVRISGDLDVGALQRSLVEIVRRHESLRTTFQLSDGLALQLVSPESSLPLDRHDLERMDSAEREHEARRIAEAQAATPFDITRGPLLRAALLRMREQDHILLVTMHHIISDGWSMGVFVREMAALYQAFSNGLPSPLADLPVQYADFACWQREWLQGETLEAQRSYWKKQLAAAPPTLELPTDFAHPPSPGPKGATGTLRLTTALSTSLRTLSQQHGVTLFMTLLAAFKLLLFRLTGQDDIIVGSPIAGRNRAEIESLIGFFVNTLVLRTDLGGRPTFVELLRRVRDVTLGAYSHQEYPFEKLVEDIHPDRDLGRNPFFQVLFNLINTPQSALRLPGLTLEFVELTEPASRFPMTAYVEDFEEALHFRLVYDPTLFSSSRIAHLLDQYNRLLEQVVEAPDRLIASHSLVTAGARAVLPDPVVRIDEPALDTVWEMFRSWTIRSPSAPAVVKDGTVTTYAELAAMVTRIAQTLLGGGLKRGDVVAIAGSRSLGLVASMIGVLRAGGVMLVVDRDLPRARRSVLIEEARARHALLVGDVALERADSFQMVGQVGAETGAVRGVDDRHGSDALSALRPGDPAYIFFTSGSTGTPKGVLGCHKGLSHFLAWQRATFEINPTDRSAQLTALSFDVLLRDILLPLVSGAALHLPPDDVDLGPDRIVPWLDQSKITVLHTVPTLARAWLSNAPSGATLASLRWIFFAGEPLPEGLVGRWREVFSGSGRIVNLYGPTETTLAKFAFTVPDEPPPGVQPVGWPLPQTQGLVLAEGDRLCGIGEPGEIVIRTPFRSLGYVNSVEESQRRFFANPFSDDPYDLLYRTGDRGRYRPDGALEILGRLDNQVKIRGVRIELQEIEAVLSQHAGVHGAAVAASEDAHGNKRLVAYVVRNPQLAARSADLRRFLKERLPEYMVPSLFVTLDSLPLTSSGKVDRRALPVPEEVPDETVHAYTAPRNAEEEVIAEIWAEVLGRERVGVFDNFFDIGGHSLLATLVVSRVRAAFRLEISLRSLFENPTVAGIAESIERLWRDSAGDLPSLTPAPRPSHVPLSFAQERMWFLNQLDPGTAAYNTFRAVRLKGVLDQPVLERSLREVVRRHENLRTVFEQIDGQPFQRTTPLGDLTIAVQDLRGLSPEDQECEIRRLAGEEIGRPFDLTRGPLIRVTLLQLGEMDRVMLLTIHHIVSDGWSMRVLIQEIVRLYQAFVAGQPSPLPELPIQYADYAVWQRGWLRGETLEKHTGYWKDRLAGSLPVLELPTDRPRALVQGFQAAEQSMTLSPALATALRKLSRQHGASLYMTLLAGFATLLQRYSGQDDILVGAPIANRNRSETEGLIGFFLNTLILRTDLSGNPTFEQLLDRVRNATLDAFAHQDLPLEHVLRAIQPDRQMTRHSLFQVMFLLQNVPPPDVEIPGLSLSLVDAERGIDLGTAIFDIALTMLEDEHGLTASMTYNEKLLHPTTVVQMLDHYRALLESAAADPSQGISGLDGMQVKDRQQLLAQAGDAVDLGGELMVHRLFEEQAERTPMQIAVQSDERRLTYGELNALANQLARHLLSRGVGPEARVAICMPRCAEMMVAVLGVLKAGAAYVPIDPAYPAERKSFMLAEAGAMLLLTTSAVAETVPDSGAGRLVLDDLAGFPHGEDRTNLQGGAAPENQAYIIFTSGSTGKPKGVMVEHRSLGNYTKVARSTYDVRPGDKVLQFASLSFDASAEEIFPALTSGATLVLRTDSMLASFSDFLDACRERGITHLDLPTAFWHELTKAVETQGLTVPSPVRVVILGGEKVLPDRVAAWMRAVPGPLRLFNTYGPTESTIVATVHELQRESVEQDPLREIPIGRPIPNARIYVLDADLRPVPVGVPGELHIGGDGLARGYLDQPQSTAERFIPDPFTRKPGDRLYRTGDRVRWREEGTIEFLGRVDDQVKVRGFRVELGEVESVLAQCPSVIGCAVTAREDAAGDRRLIAYVVAAPGETSSVSTVRAFLHDRLPNHMVPSIFVPLDSLPLTPSGKVDRKALPEPEHVRPDVESSFAAPTNDTEQKLAAIWCDVLGLERVGIHDNFFDLGGHSLLLPQVLHRVREAFHVAVPLRRLFEDPTIAGLGLVIEEQILDEIESVAEDGVV